MSRVRLLEPSVAERIAAGEVVERPASVVKELVENSLDAGSTRIWVEIRDGGQASLKVIDDGCGMTREDVELAIRRFATSKIEAWEDMESLRTFGFRGEALPSVLAVSRTEILTRPPGDAIGTRVVAHGSVGPRIEEAGCPEGTSIVVSDLFFNTPARRKFLKSAAGETGRIVELLGRIAMARTDVHFRLSSGGREVFNLPVQYGLADRVARLWNLDGALIECKGEGRGVAVRGLAALPPAFAATRSRQVFFVNGRLINAGPLTHALSQGFAPLVPDRKFPMAVIFIDVDPASVDVNIHPTKAEVRFLYPGEVFRVVRDSVAAALTRAGAEPQDGIAAVARVANWDSTDETAVDMQPPQPGTQRRGRFAPALRTGSGWSPRPLETRPQTVTPERVQATLEAMQPLLPHAEMPAPVARIAQAPGASRWQVLAQLDRTYIVALRGDDLVLVDQHTAHERIHYEALAHLSDEGRVCAQQLLFPLLLDLAADEAAALNGVLDVFEEMGYILEPFGGTTFVVRSVPAGLDALARTETLRHVIAEVVSEGTSGEAARVRERLRATTACRASVMAGDVLTREEMEILLERLEGCEHSGYCPHGRPVSVRLGAEELARLFHRK